MDETSDLDNVDDVMMPGFRFHPTDEELIGYYLKKKIQQEPLAIELIRQLDIYKYDPWDLPKLATGGEKEWYFYCPRDRKYRNSTRPNRVTVAGFWKATGTDKPIYSSEGSKFIGLKKSLVFYKGRAPKGAKTDWMMHEFRLPSPSDLFLVKRPDKHIPTNDSWAICRIFKKTSSIPHKVQSQAWAYRKTTNTNFFNASNSLLKTEFDSGNISSITQGGYEIKFGSDNDFQWQPMNLTDCKPPMLPNTSSKIEKSKMKVLPSIDLVRSNSLADVASVRLNLPPELLGDDTTTESIDFSHAQEFETLADSELKINDNIGSRQEQTSTRKTLDTCNLMSDQWKDERMMGLSFDLLHELTDEWKTNLTWEYPHFPTEILTTCSAERYWLS